MTKQTIGAGFFGMTSKNDGDSVDFDYRSDYDETAMRARVERFLAENGMKQSELSIEAGKARDFVNRLLNGRTSRPHPKSLYGLARTMGYTVKELVSPLPPPKEPELPAVLRPVPVPAAVEKLVPNPPKPVSSPKVEEMAIIGVLEDGNFRLTPAVLNRDSLPKIICERSAAFPRLPHFAFEMGDNSMELIGIAKGDLVICVDWLAANVHLAPGMLVVAEQAIGDGKYKQRTLKSVQMLPEQILLVPRSADLKYEPIAFKHPPPEDSSGVAIVAVAVSCIKNLYRA